MRIPLALLSILPLGLPSAVFARAAGASNFDTVEAIDINQRASNTIALTVHPSVACQVVKVDSFRIRPLDDTSVHTKTLGLGPDSASVELWWRFLPWDSISEKPSIPNCLTATTAARTLVRIDALPADSQGFRIVSEVISHAPSGRTDTIHPSQVYTRGRYRTLICPLYSCIRLPDTATDAEKFADLSQQVLSWLTDSGSVVLTNGKTEILRAPGQRDSASVQDIGTSDRWGIGDNLQTESVLVGLSRTWGAAPANGLAIPDGRRIYHWAGGGATSCCEKCDSLCAFPRDTVVSYFGGDLSVSSDSVRFCYGDTPDRIASDAAGTWLLLPTAEEVRRGLLVSGTFGWNGICQTGRVRAYPVQGDSVLYRESRFALADLLLVLGVHRSEAHPLRVRSTSTGWRIIGAGEGESIRLLDLSGRILFQTGGRSEGVDIAAPRRGMFVVEVGRSRQPVVR
jgi:hypothetical protein